MTPRVGPQHVREWGEGLGFVESGGGKLSLSMAVTHLHVEKTKQNKIRKP